MILFAGIAYESPKKYSSDTLYLLFLSEVYGHVLDIQFLVIFHLLPF